MSRRSRAIEGVGYIVSILSVALLARVAWIGAQDDFALKSLVALGAALSIFGMMLRWYVFSRRHRHKRHKH
jgi:hypothetical protein